jgi:DNA polymerase V
MYAIVDCNSFYCSCERLFAPSLYNKPVAVLSNNDGCIISRTDEAKALGLGMGAPYFQYRQLIEQNGITIFSSNYHLYGDISRRVMDTLRAVAGNEMVEVYSVDEAFINLKEVPERQLQHFIRELKERTEAWTGIQVSVGVAPTKVLSKAANRLAKKNKAATNCIVILKTEEEIQDVLQRTPVGDIWGIGGRYAYTLREFFAIENAWQLRQMNEEWARKNLGGVVGVRLLKELKGFSCIEMKDPLENKKMIATTRMFGKPVYELPELKEAIASYASRAAEKLRRQYCATKHIDVFIISRPDTQKPGDYYTETRHLHCLLPIATSDTQEMIRCAKQLIQQLYRPGLKYIKAGIILSDLVPDNAIQGNLFSPFTETRQKILMNALDNINFSMRDDAVRYASTGVKRNWKMRQEKRSNRYTTSWEELFEVR